LAQNRHLINISCGRKEGRKEGRKKGSPKPVMENTMRLCGMFSVSLGEVASWR
jgi:hypothetical protein